MKANVLRLLVAALIGAASAHASISFHTDFETWPLSPAVSGGWADLSFHNAAWAPRPDEFGSAIAGSERWTIDSVSDLYSPVGTANPALYGFGVAPSGSQALNALFGPVLIRFGQPFRLSSFTTTLDNSPFGDLGESSIWLLSAESIVGRIGFDATVPLAMPQWSGDATIDGIVLQGGGFYDDLAFRGQPVPEPATWGALGAAACAALAFWRRRFARKQA